MIKIMEDTLGRECSRVLKPLLFDFEAASYASDILSFRKHTVTTHHGAVALLFPLFNDSNLIATNNSHLVEPDNTWSNIYRIKIVQIGTIQ